MFARALFQFIHTKRPPIIRNIHNNEKAQSVECCNTCISGIDDQAGYSEDEILPPPFELSKNWYFLNRNDCTIAILRAKR